MAVISTLGAVSGRPVLDPEACTACGACVEACPTGTLRPGPRVDAEASFGCIACGHCMMVCPTEGIRVTGRGLEPDHLAELPSAGLRAGPDQLEALMRARRSVRHFTEAPVPQEVLERILAAAATAPMGIPPWEVGVVVLHGREQVRALAGDTARTYAGLLRLLDAPIGWLLRPFLKRATRAQIETFILPLGREIVGAHRAGGDKVLYGAPAALLFHTSPYADPADAAIACTYAMLSAESLGLGTCMIGCLAPAVARRRGLLRKYGVPDGHRPALVLILGHPATTFRRAIRRPFHSVTWPRVEEP